MTQPQHASLQSLISSKPDLVEFFYNDTLAPHTKARTSLSAAFIPPEFTNWREEQRAWSETAVLFDQSHHMPELFLKGSDAMRLVQSLAINSFSNFGPGRAKQFVACAPSGHVIGDSVLYYLADDHLELVSGMTALNWVEFQAREGNYDVEIVRDDPTPYNPTGRRILYRFQLDGPNAGAIFSDVVEGDAPEIAFFRTVKVRIAGCEVTVLRHGMAGHQGAELSGPYEEMHVVRNAIIAAGEKHGLKLGGTKAYFSTLFESGWMAYPVPAIFTGDEMRAFREWLPATGWEANTMLGGSFVSPRISDYYVNPWNLGYDRILKFDHDFIGREALERMAMQPQRQRKTLVWNPEDVAKVFGSQFGDGPRFKAMEYPVAYYGFPNFDEVRDASRKLVGLSCHCGYSDNEGAMLSLAMIDADHLADGTELVLIWGEPGGGSRKPHVERHEQTHIRVTVAPVPYSSAVQRMKRAAINARS